MRTIRVDAEFYDEKLKEKTTKENHIHIVAVGNSIGDIKYLQERTFGICGYLWLCCFRMK